MHRRLAPGHKKREALANRRVVSWRGFTDANTEQRADFAPHTN